MDKYKIRSGYKKLFQEFPFTHAVTLAYNPPRTFQFDKEKIERHLIRFYLYVESKILNKKFRLVGRDRRSSFIGMIENLETNAHIHLLWHIPDRRSLEFISHYIKEYWGYFARRGTTNTQLVYNGRGWGDYATKDMFKIYNEDNIVFGGPVL